MTTLTLEEYFKHELAAGAIDFALRASVYMGVVELYIHPSGRDGQTTPSLLVEGNRVRPKGGHGDRFRCPKCGLTEPHGADVARFDLTYEAADPTQNVGQRLRVECQRCRYVGYEDCADAPGQD